MSALDKAVVLARLHEHLDGARYRMQTDSHSGVTIEVYDAETAQVLACSLDDPTFSRTAGARVVTVSAGTVRGIPVEVIQMDVAA